MHYHAEVWLKELNNVDEQVASALAPYNENRNGEYHEDGFWDWYQIGGRWTGEHDGYNPANDPANIETCKICNGTGFRNDGLGCNRRVDEPSYTCNGCGTRDKDGKWEHSKYGRGKTLKWPTQWQKYDGDIVSLADIKDDLTCYTLIVDGQAFLQKVWTGNDFEETDFNGNVLEKLQELGINDGFLITVDYHC